MTKEEAEQKAQELCERLGPGWEPKVWNNMGWHWCVQNQVISVWLSYDNVYRALINSEEHLGSGKWISGKGSKNPLQAIRNSLAIASTDAIERSNIVLKAQLVLDSSYSL